LTFRWNKEKTFFADFHKITKEFCENQQKNLKLCKKPATHRKSDFSVLSFFYEENPSELFQFLANFHFEFLVNFSSEILFKLLLITSPNFNENQFFGGYFYLSD
jgi:hypothetical protein